MALTITKMTNGYFLFESNSQKNGSSNPQVRQKNDNLYFYDFKEEFIEGPIPFGDITVIDGVTPVDDLDSAEAIVDALYELGMFPTVVTAP